MPNAKTRLAHREKHGRGWPVLAVCALKSVRRGQNQDGMMHSLDDHIALRDFVAWMRRRRPIQKDAWVDENTLEYVTLGIERFLAGQSPWPKKKGNKPKPDVMWRAYWLCDYFTQGDTEQFSKLARRHKQPDGLYAMVGKKMHLSADAVESLVRKARQVYKTQDGERQFLNWLGKEKGANWVQLFSADHPEALAYLEGEGKKYASYVRPVSSQKSVK